MASNQPHQNTNAPAGHAPPQRSATEQLLPQGSERSEQIETLQHYESQGAETDDDRNQATLQREFPTIDSSLIAAIYGDSKSLSATREMLQELSSGN